MFLLLLLLFFVTTVFSLPLEGKIKGPHHNESPDNNMSKKVSHNHDLTAGYEHGETYRSDVSVSIHLRA